MSRLNNFFCHNPKNEVINLIYKDSNCIATESINEYKLDRIGVHEYHFFNRMKYNNSAVLIYKGYYSTENIFENQGFGKYYHTNCGHLSGEYFDNSYNNFHPNDGKYDIANLNIIQNENCTEEYGHGLGIVSQDEFRLTSDCGFNNGANYKMI